ncbi:MAG: 5-formyltetrahydrofolate cyclo-ligase [Alphaproteobacteria bacterium]|nr:MAG: 5-formyltetrahydrofolate cyclo-ligase [Alphaproteobacteria bacterium]
MYSYSIPTTKKVLREKLRTQLTNQGKNIHPHVGVLFDSLNRLLDTLAVNALGGYFPLRGEPDLSVLLDAWIQKGVRCLYPRIQGKKMSYAWITPGTYTLKDSYNCLVGENLAPEVPDAIIVPFLGYTRTGYRLGRGGGFIDRYLVANPHVIAIGVGYASQEISMTVEPHDKRLAYVVTDQETLSFYPH